MSNLLCETGSLVRCAVRWTAIAGGAALLATLGCSSDVATSPASAGTDSGYNVTAVPTPGAAGASSNPNVGSSASAGGNAAAGSASGGQTSTAGGAAQKPCVDVPPPFDPNWPDATCQKWAHETSECGKDWFAQYCDLSCGRCMPATSGSGGSGGGGASTSSGGSGGVAGSVSSAGAGGSDMPASDCSAAGLPNVTSGNGFATRYWDCCQTHCGQYDGHRCGSDGTTRTGDNNSACVGGGSYACYDEAPKAVSDCLSYGYIAKANPACGQCYRIQFTGEAQYTPNDPGSAAIKGKQMIVKVSNTGGDVGANQFDLMIPGGGVGMFNACSNQWGTSDLGAQYGGFLTNCKGSHSDKMACVRQQCTKIPAGAARDGCLWFVDWFQVADNPKFTSEPTDCPF